MKKLDKILITLMLGFVFSITYGSNSSVNAAGSLEMNYNITDIDKVEDVIDDLIEEGVEPVTKAEIVNNQTGETFYIDAYAVEGDGYIDYLYSEKTSPIEKKVGNSYIKLTDIEKKSLPITKAAGTGDIGNNGETGFYGITVSVRTYYSITTVRGQNAYRVDRTKGSYNHTDGSLLITSRKA